MSWFYDSKLKKKLTVYYAEKKGESIRIYHYDDDGDKTMKTVHYTDKDYSNATKCLNALKARDKKDAKNLGKYFNWK